MVHRRKPSDALDPRPGSSRDCRLGSIGFEGYRTMVRGHGVGQALVAKADLVEGDTRRRSINGNLQSPSIISLHPD